MSDYVQLRTLEEARVVAKYLHDVQARAMVAPTQEYLERERVTLELRRQFLALDLRVHDDWSLSGDTREAPLPAWRRR